VGFNWWIFAHANPSPAVLGGRHRNEWLEILSMKSLTCSWKQYVEVGSSTGIHKNIQEKTHLIGG
jgi:hypothetical protein